MTAPTSTDKDSTTEPAEPSGSSPAVGPGSPGARETAAELVRLALLPSLAGRKDQLERLARALSDRDQVDGWSEVPLHKALGYPPSGQDEVDRPAMRLLNALRVVLVFVPVFVTWWGVSRAAALYREELARDPELAAQSFFRLWLNGFDGRLWLTFDRMALGIALILGTLILISLYIEARRSFYELTAARRQRELQNQLSSTLTDASVHLARGQLASPERFQAELARTAEGLASLTAQVTAAAEAATAVISRIEPATSAVHEAAAHARDGASTLARSVEGLTDGLARSEATATRLVTEVNAHAEAASATIAAATQRSVDGLADHIADLRNEVDRVAARSDETLEKVGTRFGEHREAMDQLVPEIVDKIAETQTAALHQQLSDLNQAIRSLAAAERRLAESVKHRLPRAGPARLTGPKGWLSRWFGG